MWPWTRKLLNTLNIIGFQVQVELPSLLNTVLSNQEKIMSGQSDLAAAVTALTAAVTAIDTYLQGLPAAILALQGSADPDAAIEAFAQQVQTQTASLTSNLSSAPTLANISAGTVAAPPAPPPPASSGTPTS